MGLFTDWGKTKETTTSSQTQMDPMFRRPAEDVMGQMSFGKGWNFGGPRQAQNTLDQLSGINALQGDDPYQNYLGALSQQSAGGFGGAQGAYNQALQNLQGFMGGGFDPLSLPGARDAYQARVNRLEQDTARSTGDILNQSVWKALGGGVDPARQTAGSRRYNESAMRGAQDALMSGRADLYQQASDDAFRNLQYGVNTGIGLEGQRMGALGQAAGITGQQAGIRDKLLGYGMQGGQFADEFRRQSEQDRLGAKQERSNAMNRYLQTLLQGGGMFGKRTGTGQEFGEKANKFGEAWGGLTSMVDAFMPDSVSFT